MGRSRSDPLAAVDRIAAGRRVEVGSWSHVGRAPAVAAGVQLSRGLVRNRRMRGTHG